MKFKFMGFIITLSALVILFISGMVLAAENPSNNNRIDLTYSYYYLEPHGLYGSWNIGTVTYYNNSNKKFNYFIQGSGFSRTIEGEGFLGTVGTYGDWTPWFYTYTDVSIGTNYLYLPEFRADNNFNFKLGKNRNLVWEIGGSYIKYNSDNVNLIASTGLTDYYKRWIFSYRLFRTVSDPGSVVSWSHLYSIAYGKRYWERTYLNIITGNEAYLEAYQPTVYPVNSVNYNAIYVEVHQRIWLRKDFGILGTISYLTIQGNYKAFGVTAGIFKNF